MVVKYGTELGTRYCLKRISEFFTLLVKIKDSGKLKALLFNFDGGYFQDLSVHGATVLGFTIHTFLKMSLSVVQLVA